MATRAERRRLWLAAAGLFLVLGGWLLGSAGFIHAKAWLAQHLLERAWAGSAPDGRADPSAVRPWPWADTYPVARLSVPRLGLEQIVLAGASGRTLAFGPGHMDGTAPPGSDGHSLLSGHRDTHFRFLEDLRPGDEIRIQRPDRGWRSYRVRESRVLPTPEARLRRADGTAALTLVTCYPFDAVDPGGPQRYLVSAVAVD